MSRRVLDQEGSELRGPAHSADLFDLLLTYQCNAQCRFWS